MNIAEFLKSKGRAVGPPEPKGDLTYIDNQSGRVSRVIEKPVAGGTELEEIRRLEDLERMGYSGAMDGHGRDWHGAVASSPKEAEALAKGAARAAAEDSPEAVSIANAATATDY